jgi:glutamate-1-semialdehyde 2,1-aminomutase
MAERSRDLFERAQKYIPGGVNSPVRAFKSVGGTPRFISRASGSKLYDVDGREYIDYVGSWGPMILGHAHPAVIEAVIAAARKGTSYGAPTESEIEIAEMTTEAFPSIDMVRMVNSGTEAVISAIRLARAFTGRSRIVKFEGCYHGHGDSLLAKAGSGIATFGIPGTPGIPAELAALTLTVPYNDIVLLRSVLDQSGDEIACIIIEPVPGNMGVVKPKPDYLEEIRRITLAKGILLIFDEVITGFRLSYGGFQTLSGIKPDLTCLGKIIGGGLPVGAFGGRRDIMEMLAPNGPVYQAGTLSGNPLAMAAGIATLRELRNGAVYESLDKKGAAACRELRSCFLERGIPVVINRMGSMFTIFFTPDDVYDFASASKSDVQRYAKFFHGMLDNGLYLAPSQFEAAFVSAAHSDTDLDKTISACRETLARVF